MKASVRPQSAAVSPVNQPSDCPSLLEDTPADPRALPDPSSRPNRLTELDLKAGVQLARIYARWFVKRHPGTDPANAESGAIEGAYRAWLTYDPRKGTLWKTHCKNMVRWYVHKTTRPAQEHSYKKFLADGNRMVSLDFFLFQGNMAGDHRPSNETKWDESDITADPESDHSNQATEWKDVLDRMEKDQRDLIQLHYYEGFALAAAGRMMGLTSMQVWRLHGQAIKSLRALLVQDGVYSTR